MWLCKLCVLYVIVLVFDHIFRAVCDLYSCTLFAAVARNKSVTVAETYDSKIAVRSAAAALNGSWSIWECFKFLSGNEWGTFFRVLWLLLCEKRTAESAHKSSNSRSYNVSAQLLFKGTENSVVKESSALNDDIFAQFVNRFRSDYLVYSVFDDRCGKSCRDILNGRTVLLCLLYGGVHEYSTSWTKLHRCFCEKTEPCKFCDIVSHCSRKGLNERAAAWWTGLVEHDAVDSVVLYLKALYILSADVDDKINVGAEVSRSLVMRHSFNYTVINSQTCLDKILAVACNSRCLYPQLRVCKTVYLSQLSRDYIQWLSLIGAVVLIEQLSLRSDKHKLCCGRACVDAEISVALIGLYVLIFKVRLLVSFNESGIVSLRLKERIADNDIVLRLCVCYLVKSLVNGHLLRKCVSVESRTVSHIAWWIFREYSVFLIKVKSSPESLSQCAEVCKRTAEEKYLSLYLSALSKTWNSLVNDSLKNRCGDIFLSCALIEQRLYIRLSENAAAWSDRISFLSLESKLVHLCRCNAQQTSHLIYERTCTACAWAVHSLLNTACEEDYLSVLTAQLNYNVCLRVALVYGNKSGENLLHEWNAAGFCDTESCRTCYGYAELILRIKLFDDLKLLRHSFTHSGEVTLIFIINEFTVVKNNSFYGSRTNVDTEVKDPAHKYTVCIVFADILLSS